VEAKKIIENT